MYHRDAGGTRPLRTAGLGRRKVQADDGIGIGHAAAEPANRARFADDFGLRPIPLRKVLVRLAPANARGGRLQRDRLSGLHRRLVEQPVLARIARLGRARRNFDDDGAGTFHRDDDEGRQRLRPGSISGSCTSQSARTGRFTRALPSTSRLESPSTTPAVAPATHAVGARSRCAPCAAARRKDRPSGSSTR